MKNAKCLLWQVVDARILLAVLLLLTATVLQAPNYVSAEPVIQAKRTRIVQVALDQKPKISQYLDIDSTPQGYGKNACGLVAAAAAVAGENWEAVVGWIATAAGSDYGQQTGIQPSRYVAALQNVYGIDPVTAWNDTTVEKIYDELAAGNIVIVDIKVSATSQNPSAIAPNYAHFARVLGIDMTSQQIYIENTLSGEPYWTLSLRDFINAWERPETTVSEIPDPRNVEEVTHWIVVLDGSLSQENGV